MSAAINKNKKVSANINCSWISRVVPKNDCKFRVFYSKTVFFSIKLWLPCYRIIQAIARNLVKICDSLVCKVVIEHISIFFDELQPNSSKFPSFFFFFRKKNSKRCPMDNLLIRIYRDCVMVLSHNSVMVCHQYSTWCIDEIFIVFFALFWRENHFNLTEC